MFGGRPLSNVVRALANSQHYEAVLRSFSVYENPVDSLGRYLFRKGAYPADVRLNTPLGRISVRLFCPDDVLTVNEVFCRSDYRADAGDKVCVDFGSNIGISAAYFLTRSADAVAYLFEPLPQNVERLKQNVGQFVGRYELQPVAVGPFEGEVDFGWEPTGRYGGIGIREGREKIRVRCLDSNSVLEQIVSRHGAIDILKIDVEGGEHDLVERIPLNLAPHIRKIYVEAGFDVNPLAATHTCTQRGSIARFLLKPG